MGFPGRWTLPLLVLLVFLGAALFLAEHFARGGL